MTQDKRLVLTIELTFTVDIYQAILGRKLTALRHAQSILNQVEMQEWLQYEKQKRINGQTNKIKVTISFNYLIISQRMSTKIIRLAPL